MAFDHPVVMRVQGLVHDVVFVKIELGGGHLDWYDCLARLEPVECRDEVLDHKPPAGF